MAEETIIPMLPCDSLSEVLGFYRDLGFEVTHEQETPYAYGAVRRGGIDLHFHPPKGSARKGPGGTCLVIVPKVGPYHEAFSDALRAKHGKVPTAGHPRITRLMKGQTRFTTLDPFGNSVVYIDRDEPDIDYGAYEPKGSRLAQTLDNATFLRDVYINDKAAAQVLDKALARDEPPEPIDRARALACRAEIALAMGDAERAASARAELRQIPLSDEDRERHRDELLAPDTTERWIG